MEVIKKQSKRDLMIDYFTKKSESVENYKDQILIFKYSNPKNFPCVAIFEKRDKKPSYHYSFNNELQRDKFISQRKKSADNEAEWAEKMNKKAIEEAEKMVIGSILYSGWGYEQTNIDFYVIVERVGITVKLQQIGGVRKYSSDMAGTVTPNIDLKIGEPFKKRINKYGCINLNSYSRAYIYDGKPKMFSIYA